MPNSFFRFKQFTVYQEQAAMKVGTDGVLLGAWATIGDNVNRILDIGTGTGIVALMLAQRSIAQIDAVEIDESSAKQAKANFELSQWANRLAVHQTDFQSYSKSCVLKYDLVVSNPPYFSRSLKSPELARTLVRHTDLLPHNQLLEGVSLVLSATGSFCAVFPYTEGNVFVAIAATHGLYCNRRLNIYSIPGKPVIRVLLEFSFSRGLMEEQDIYIHNKEGHYTEAYKNLTKDFYLAF